MSHGYYHIHISGHKNDRNSYDFDYYAHDFNIVIVISIGRHESQQQCPSSFTNTERTRLDAKVSPCTQLTASSDHLSQLFKDEVGVDSAHHVSKITCCNKYEVLDCTL